MGNQTNHYKNKRYKREKFINEHLCGDGNIIDSFIVNRNHPNGEEIHELRDNGLIIIYNKNTGYLITKIIARENQIKRYYSDSEKEPSKQLLNLARNNERKGFNRL